MKKVMYQLMNFKIRKECNSSEDKKMYFYIVAVLSNDLLCGK